VRKPQPTDSVVSINVVKSSTASTITVALPKDVQQSATPLGGKLRVKCTDSRGAVAYTRDFDIWRDDNSINLYIAEDCPGFHDKQEVYV